MKYDVKLGSTAHKGWGVYEGENEAQVVAIIKKQIESLHPINASPEGVEAYRNRFRGLAIYLRAHGNKEYRLAADGIKY